jgi:hypothetical protein
MFDFLCTQPRYDYGDKTPAPAAPTVPGLLDGLGLSSLWQAPTPHYEGQPATAAASSSPGLLCWLVGSPTPAYQTATPKPSKTTGR